MTAVIPGTSLAIHPERFPDPVDDLPTDGIQKAILAGGCFWCVEAVYLNLDGVLAVTSGYAGGHAQLLKVFFSVAHDPTQKDRQGNDRGTQYRSAIFYQSPEEKAVAEAYIHQLDNAGAFTAPIVTTLESLETFYRGEDYHQNFASHNPNQGYIVHVAKPKVEKLIHAFPDLLKRDTQ